MLVSELNEIKGSQFCMLITTYTVLGTSNYSGITIDLLKKPNLFNIILSKKYEEVGHCVETLSTVAVLAFITTCTSYWLSESVTE